MGGSPRLAWPSDVAAPGVRPKKGLGQNFLVDAGYRAEIVEAAQITPADSVLEIGPGQGALTGLLAAQAGRLVTVELDDRLIPGLRHRFAGQANVIIVHGDILDLDIGALMGESRYKVVANLPYYISGAVLRRLMEAEPPPSLMVLTLQEEVAERVTAVPPRMSLLALGVQFYCSARIVARLPAAAFYPVPKVDSAVVRLEKRASTATADVPAEAFFAVARAGFSQPRKQLRNSLAAGLQIPPGDAESLLHAAGITPHRRAETLALGEWAALARVLPRGGHPSSATRAP